MPIATVPKYLGSDFSSASPALRFGMYLNKDENRTSALASATPLNETDRESIAAHVQRQRAVFNAAGGADGLALMAKSVAPFTTGLGNEHPLENGFAFLNPYGLPYLPGSGVKGVVRRAAEELAHPDFFQDGGGWTLPAIWHLFGFEPWPAARQFDAEWEGWIDGFSASREEIGAYLNAVLEDTPGSWNLKDRVLQADSPKRKLLQERQLHVRGALEFWDVVPQVNGSKLAVEIMTPHHSHYYQSQAHTGSESPHDSGSPNPISFLTVPPGSDFVFQVRCDHRRLSRNAPGLAIDGLWHTLLEGAFEHAFKWIGFGAKTAVGYGAMGRDRAGECAARDHAASERARREAETREEDRLAEMRPIEREIESIVDARQDKGMSEVMAVIQQVVAGRWAGNKKVEVAEWLRNRMTNEGRWKETSKKRRPEKDKDHQNTLLVKSWLEARDG